MYNFGKRKENMAKTTPVYARIDSDLKQNAETIMSQLGVNPSSLIQMLYSQIVLRKKIPFEVSLGDVEIPTIANMTKEELNSQLQKGYNSIRSGKTYSEAEVDLFFENKNK